MSFKITELFAELTSRDRGYMAAMQGAEKAASNAGREIAKLGPIADHSFVEMALKGTTVLAVLGNTAARGALLTAGLLALRVGANQAGAALVFLRKSAVEVTEGFKTSPQAGFDALTASALRGATAITALRIKIMALTGAAVGLPILFAAIGVSAVKQFAEGERAAQGLISGLTAIGNHSESERARLLEYSKSIQLVTTYTNSQIQSAMRLGVTIGNLTGPKLREATTAAIGLAEAYGIDLESAMKLLDKAALGNTDTLKRFGIILDDTLTPQEKFNELLDIGNGFMQLATDRTNTLAGAWEQFWNSDMLEGIGGLIAGPLTSLIKWANDFANGLVEIKNKLAKLGETPARAQEREVSDRFSGLATDDMRKKLKAESDGILRMQQRVGNVQLKQAGGIAEWFDSDEEAEARQLRIMKEGHAERTRIFQARLAQDERERALNETVAKEKQRKASEADIQRLQHARDTQKRLAELEFDLTSATKSASEQRIDQISKEGIMTAASLKDSLFAGDIDAVEFLRLMALNFAATSKKIRDERKAQADEAADARQKEAEGMQAADRQMEEYHKKEMAFRRDLQGERLKAGDNDVISKLFDVESWFMRAKEQAEELGQPLSEVTEVFGLKMEAVLSDAQQSIDKMRSSLKETNVFGLEQFSSFLQKGGSGKKREEIALAEKRLQEAKKQAADQLEAVKKTNEILNVIKDKPTGLLIG
jgi:hypothetical protein